MTTYVVPQNLSRRALELLSGAQRHADENGVVWPTGTPPSSLTTLKNALRKDARNIRTALRELEREGMAHTYLLVHKERASCRAQGGGRGHGGWRVVVNVSGTPWVAGLCATCGIATNGTGRWCAEHKQKEGRHDRKWQVAAEHLLELGYPPLKIAGLLRRPYLVASNDDGRSANGGAVVPYLLGRGLLGLEWTETLRAATMGNEEA